MTIVGTRPYVYAAGVDIGGRFELSQNEMHGLGLRANHSFHPMGRAIDFMVGKDKAKGDALAQWVKAHAAEYGATEVIWWQAIWTTARAGEGWRSMPNRGSDTANHKDHVHVSFGDQPGTGVPTGGTTGSGSNSGNGGNCLPVLLAATIGSLGWLSNLYLFAAVLGG